jgi:hypothetical protein
MTGPRTQAATAVAFSSPCWRTELAHALEARSHGLDVNDQREWHRGRC